MSEYTFCGLVLFGCIALIVGIYAICHFVEKAIKSRKIKALKKVVKRMKDIEDYAEFVALASKY